MKLDVIQSREDSSSSLQTADCRLPAASGEAPAWYADGLRFTCQNCGNCCTGGPGYVWISQEELQRLAAHLKLSIDQTMDRYCRRVGERISLKESRTAQGLYDCVFLKEEKVARRGPDGKRITQTNRICTAYDARPLQCRTWPFWSEVVASKKSWQIASRKCHGMDIGRTWTPDEVDRLKDATDWPDRAPTSDRKPG